MTASLTHLHALRTVFLAAIALSLYTLTGCHSMPDYGEVRFLVRDQNTLEPIQDAHVSLLPLKFTLTVLNNWQPNPFDHKSSEASTDEHGFATLTVVSNGPSELIVNQQGYLQFRGMIEPARPGVPDTVWYLRNGDELQTSNIPALRIDVVQDEN